jgi:hypothetical protein
MVVQPNGSTKDVAEPIRTGQLVGDYSAGGGTGYNLDLRLKEGGRFECTWHGCLGVYGTTAGAWSLGEAGLKFIPEKADGMFKNQPLGTLRVISHQQHYILVQERDLDLLKKYGPSTFVCLHQRAARKSLER